MQMFARDGFDATTNRAIAGSSGLTSAAIYHYFSSKAELYAAVYEEVFERVFTEFEKAIVGQPTMVAQYTAVLDAAARMNQEDPTVPAFVTGAAGEAQRHPELTQLLRPLQRRSTMFFRRLVVSAAERGELAPDVDVRAVEDLLNAILIGLARLSSVNRDVRRHAASVDALQRVFDGTLLRQ